MKIPWIIINEKIKHGIASLVAILLGMSTVAILMLAIAKALI